MIDNSVRPAGVSVALWGRAQAALAALVVGGKRERVVALLNGYNALRLRFVPAEKFEACTVALEREVNDMVQWAHAARERYRARYPAIAQIAGPLVENIVQSMAVEIAQSAPPADTTDTTDYSGGGGDFGGGGASGSWNEP